MCDGLVTIMDRQPGITVVANVIDGAKALELAIEARPDVVLMDVRMPVMDGVEEKIELHQRIPTIQVMTLITFDDDAYIIDALSAGAVWLYSEKHHGKGSVSLTRTRLRR